MGLWNKDQLTDKSIRWTIYILTMWIAVQVKLAESIGEMREYCQWETFNATCPHNHVILMTSAVYGRMRFGRCVKENHGNVGCQSNVLPQLDRICSGRRTCSLGIPSNMLHNIHSCSKELVPYLEASYQCREIQTTSLQSCITSGGLHVAHGSGNLASETPAKKGVGTSQCPWIIEAKQGQQINLTLYGFGSIRNPSSLDIEEDTEMEDCGSHIVIEDSGIRKRVSACGQLARERPLYISDSSSVEVYVENVNHRIQTTFIIKYSAVGCPDIANIKNAWTSRKGDTAVVKCNYTGETYFLSCDGAKWKGELGNCSKVTALGASPKVEERGESRFPYGLLIVIGIGVALGVAFGILMLFGILYFLKRRGKKQTRHHTMDPLLSDHPPDNEDAVSNIYDKTRIVRCPHGLAAVTLNPEGAYYPEGMEQQPPVNLTSVSVPMQIDKGDTGDRKLRPEGECIYSREGSSLTRSFNKRKNEMQTSFTTFRPGVIQEDPRGEGDNMTYRSLQRHDQPLDLIRDSRPYRELNAESLVGECTCSLQGQAHTCCQPDKNKSNAPTAV